MEGFDLIGFKMLLWEALIEKNIDPRLVERVNLERMFEHMNWLLRIGYRDLPDHMVFMDQIITNHDAQVQGVDRIYRQAVDHFTRMIEAHLIPDKDQWWVALGEMLRGERE